MIEALWLIGIIVAWAAGVRRGKHLREGDIELAYSLGVADGQRTSRSRSTPIEARDGEERLVEEAVLEVAESRALAWLRRSDDT